MARIGPQRHRKKKGVKSLNNIFRENLKMKKNIQSQTVKFSWRCKFRVTIARYIVVCTAKNLSALQQ
jgi:ABC-type Na+ transport system ATPase subunit NatA